MQKAPVLGDPGVHIRPLSQYMYIQIMYVFGQLNVIIFQMVHIVKKVRMVLNPTSPVNNSHCMLNKALITWTAERKT